MAEGVFIADAPTLPGGRGDKTDSNTMPGGGASKAEVGRTERAATRRNKIFTSQMNTDLREIDRSMKIALRQIEITRKELYTEMDSLEARSGWLRDIEKNALPPDYLNRRASTTPHMTNRRSSSLDRNSPSLMNHQRGKKEVHVAILVGHHNNAGEQSSRPVLASESSNEQHQQGGDDNSQPQPPEFLRSQTDLPIPPTPDSAVPGIRNGVNRAATSMSGAKFKKAQNKFPSKSSQMRLNRKKTAASLGHQSGGEDSGGEGAGYYERQTPDGVFEDFSGRYDAFASPTQSILSIVRNQSPSNNRLYSSDSLSSEKRAKSLVFIPANDSRYTVMDIPLKQIDIKKIKEHALASQKLRFEGRHMLIKKNAKASHLEGSVELGGEYVPKRVRVMREERLKMRQLSQEIYNKNLVEVQLAKFKELYVVPSNGGLNEAKDFIAGLK